MKSINKWGVVFDLIEKDRVRASYRAAYELVAANRARSHPLLSGRLVQAVRYPKNQYVFDIASVTFSEALVDRVAEVLPMGVTTDRPAMLLTCKLPSKKYFWTLATYTDLTNPSVLWVDNQKPDWLRE